MKTFCKVILLVYICAHSYLITEGTHSRCRTRSLQTLTTESKAIVPGGILSYNDGQLSAILREYKNITRYPYDTQCIAPSTYNHLSRRASCPWKFVENIDENRIPRVIYEVVCRTNICSGENLIGCSRQGCEEIKHFTWVKRKGKVRSDPELFQNILEPVSVGCTCACKRVPRSFSGVQRQVMCT